MPENVTAMPTTDKRVDAYIAKSADFAQPILRHIREVIHDGCPDVEETIKWSFPVFTYKGMLANMAAFKQHCSFGFWKASLILGEHEKNAMGNFGRLTSVKDLPPKKELLKLVKEAARLNEQGISKPKPKPQLKKELVVPPHFLSALKKSKKAQSAFDAFSYSHKKEYIEWITDAKTDETRDRRIAQALEWIAEGKSRNWKYANC
ncbi:MAG TPA: YdeI/OmpD-associated family protein [Candidatus Koribacter sp.]|jgi:uncharacterized protein YdeI (YjbR/CyaY-like superfamily)